MKSGPLLTITLAIAVVLLIANTSDGPAWARQAHAAGAGKESAQRILFTGEIENRERIDRDDPYLPPITDQEARDGRAENFDRCRVAVSVYKQTGQVARISYDEPKLLFAVRIGGERWQSEGPNEAMLEDLACYFAAGDVRRQLSFNVEDDQGTRLGTWRMDRFVSAGEGDLQ